LHPSVIQVAPGDTLILVTDGIREDFAEQLTAKGPNGCSADRILARHAKDTDDALGPGRAR
jgi:serine phosphatase RsbU (regulator of sigma subunit)